MEKPSCQRLFNDVSFQLSIHEHKLAHVEQHPAEILEAVLLGVGREHSSSGRMSADLDQRESQIHHALSIQFEPRDCGSADRCQADDSGLVVAPNEVLVPIISARMKEPNLPASHYVQGGDCRVFPAVASLA